MKEQYTTKTKETLLDNIKHHNELYRKGTPEISDVEYDAEVEQLRKLDPDSDWFKHIEPPALMEKKGILTYPHEIAEQSQKPR